MGIQAQFNNEALEKTGLAHLSNNDQFTALCMINQSMQCLDDMTDDQIAELKNSIIARVEHNRIDK